MKDRITLGRAAELEAMSEEAVRSIPPERIEEYERAMGQWMTFEPRGGVLSSLVGDGQLGLIRDGALRWNYFGDIGKPGSGDLLAELRKDPEMTALVRSKLFFGSLYAGELRRLSEHGEKVLVAIRANRD